MTLALRDIHKSFAGIRALSGVDLDVGAGEIVGLVGGNGAGKSTLMKVAAGVYLPDGGSVSINGSRPHGPADAIRLGVSLVRQELIQADDLDVASNVLLGHEPHRFGVIRRPELYARAEKFLQRVGADMDSRTPLRHLSPGQRQRVEIARALSLEANILLLDEPTAMLTESDASRLFELLRQLRADGLSLVYISHRLREVMEITDRVVCLRDGCRVADFRTAEATPQRLVEQLAGSTMTAVTEPPSHGDEVALAVRGRVSFDLHAGEILGLAGLVGAGRTSLLRELFADVESALEVKVFGETVRLKTPLDAIRAGLAYVPEERATEGLMLDLLVEWNIALPSLTRFLLEDERGMAEPFMQRFGIRGGDVARTLSGGNQQKVVLAKWMALNPGILLLDEPTRGLDIQAKRDVHDVIRQLAREGKAVLVSSSEADELAQLCHRSLVLSRGVCRGELSREQLSDANILALAT